MIGTPSFDGVIRDETTGDGAEVNALKQLSVFQSSTVSTQSGDSPSIDAFARLRVSENYTLFDSKQLHDKQPLFWDEELGGSATSTHVTANADVEMVVTASAADYVIRQTKQRFNYQPGKSQLVLMTLQGEQIEGLTKRVGYFDGTGTNNLTPNNGIFYETDGDISWNICKNGTVTETALQADWNEDTLDGSGDAGNPSGIELDTIAAQILIIDFEWLGVGRVRVGYVIGGIPIYTHFFKHANDPAFSEIYMSSPNLPLRYSIETDGTTGGELDHICCCVISEGGQQDIGSLRTIDTGAALVTGLSSGSLTAVVGIRLKAAYYDVSVIADSLSAVVGTNDDIRWTLHINPTINGTFTYADLANSAVQYALGAAANTMSSGGTVLASGFGSKSVKQVSSELSSAIRIGSTIAGVQDTLVLGITPIGNNVSVAGALNWRELI